MLVPGEYLTTPVAPAKPPAPPADAGVAAEPAATVPAEAVESEPKSFLMILLKALGAVHT